MPGYGRGRIRTAPKAKPSPTGLTDLFGKPVAVPKFGKAKPLKSSSIDKAVKSGGLSKPSRGTLNKAAEKMFSGKFR